jgi:hypothetical protein
MSSHSFFVGILERLAYLGANIKLKVKLFKQNSGDHIEPQRREMNYLKIEQLEKVKKYAQVKYQMLKQLFMKYKDLLDLNF